MFRSDRTDANLRKSKTLGSLWALMSTAKLVDVVWVEIISMEILHTYVLPILITIMPVLFTGMLPILVSM